MQTFLSVFICNEETENLLTKNVNGQSDRPPSDGFLTPLRIQSPENPDVGWTFQFPSVIATSVIKRKQTLHQVPGS